MSQKRHREDSEAKIEVIPLEPLGNYKNNNNGPVRGGDSSSGGGRGRYNSTGVAVCSYQKALCVTGLVLSSLLATALVIAYAGPQNDCTCAGKMPPDFVPEDLNVTTPIVPLATNGQPFPWLNVRLPTFAKPSRYNITIHPNLTTLDVKGVVFIEFNVDKETNFIIVNSKNLTIIEKAVVGPKGHTLKIVKFLEYRPTCQLYIEVREKLRRRGNYTLSLRFTRKLSREPYGLYVDSFQDSNGEKRYVAATNFPPGGARSAYPCFDEPHLKAKVQLSIIRDRFHIALFSTPVSATHEAGFYLGQELLRDDFFETPPTSPGSIGWLISDFQRKSRSLTRGLTVSVYASEKVLPRTDFVLVMAHNILEYFENWLSIEYPLNKLDLVALPSLGPPVWSSWGLLCYQQVLLSDPNDTSTAQHQEVGTLISEQLVTQWFGGMTSVSWWSDQWLFQGLIELLGAQALADVEKQWPVHETFLMAHVLPALWSDALESATAIEAVVMEPSEIPNVFDDLAYSKSASLLRMLGSALGEGVLHAGLGDFLLTQKYLSVNQGDLWAALERQCNHSLSIKLMMKTWTQQAGSPLITVERNESLITVSQNKFMVTPRDKNANGNANVTTISSIKTKTRWIIPISYYTDNSNETTILWLNNTDSISFNVTTETLWIKINEDHSGFYRVLYPQDNWVALSSALQSGHHCFSPLDRAGLLDDAFTLCRADKINCSVPLDLSLYLTAERSLGPWEVAIKHICAWGRRLAERSAFPHLQEFFKLLLKPTALDLGWSDNGNETIRILRARILTAAVEYGDEDALNNAHVKFSNWMTKNTSVAPNLREVVYAAGVASGGAAEWNFCWNRYRAIKSRSMMFGERNALLRALCAPRIPWLLYQLLEWSLDRTLVPADDVKIILQYVTRNPVGRNLAWRHVKTHWKLIVNEFGNGTRALADVIHSVAQDMSSTFDFKELSNLVNDVIHGSGSLRMAQTLEMVRLNVRWVETQSQRLGDWLVESYSNLKKSS